MNSENAIDWLFKKLIVYFMPLSGCIMTENANIYLPRSRRLYYNIDINIVLSIEDDQQNT